MSDNSTEQKPKGGIAAFKDVCINVIKCLKLAYEIDADLLVKYYLTAFVGGVAPIITLFVLKYFIDQLIHFQQIPSPNGVPLLLVYLLAAYFVGRFAEIALYWGLNVGYYDYLLRNRLQNGLMYRFSKKVSSLDLEHLEDPEIQNLITKVHDSYLWQIPDFIRVWNYLFSNLVGAIIACIFLSPFGWWVPFVIILVSLPRFYFKVRNGNFVWSMYGSGAPEAKKLWYYSWLLVEMLPILETRVFQSQEALLSKVKKTQEYLYKINKKPLDSYIKVSLIAPLLENIVAFGVVYYFIPDVLVGLVTVGSISFITNTLETLKGNTAWGASHVGELYEKSLFIEPYFELMALPTLIHEKRRPHIFKKVVAPHIEFRNVSFTYPRGKEVLKNVSFTIESGENIAFVGKNGAGKSTIIKLICRFYDVTSGEILINGVNIKDLKLSHWYEHLGTLFQDFMKYQFSIRENIMLGKPGLEDEKRMIEAAKQSGAHDFITKYKAGYDQMLGKRFEDGEELSGGQWQKLAIARAFYQHAPVLILDEPTSAIDAEAEFEIFNNLEKVYKNRTLILVSHRFSTVRNADKIVVIENGKVVEEGTHEALLKKKGQYTKMFNTQAKGYH